MKHVADLMARLLNTLSGWSYDLALKEWAPGTSDKSVYGWYPHSLRGKLLFHTADLSGRMAEFVERRYDETA